MPADPEDAASPASRPQPAAAGSLEASFLKSVFAELSGRPAPAAGGKGCAAGASAATAGIACPRDFRRK